MTLSNFKPGIRMGIPLILAAFFALAPTRTAEAGYYGHHGYSGHHGYGRGYYGYGYGHYSPYYGYGSRYRHYGPTGGLDLDVARQVGLGALDVSVRPKRRVEVYLDGEYLGVAGNFDGYPSYLWLKEGSYQLVFYRDGYRTIEREYTIRPGVVTDVRLRMEQGRSLLPEEFAARRADDRAGKQDQAS